MANIKQQKKRVAEGEEILVSLYLDKSERLCATMNVYKELRTDSPYQKDDKVTGTVYEISPNFGAFVAVDDMYSGLIYRMLGIPAELYTPLFASARIAGWCAHRIEEMLTGGKIMRPAYKTIYKVKEYTPISERSDI